MQEGVGSSVNDRIFDDNAIRIPTAPISPRRMKRPRGTLQSLVLWIIIFALLCSIAGYVTFESVSRFHHWRTGPDDAHDFIVHFGYHGPETCARTHESWSPRISSSSSSSSDDNRKGGDNNEGVRVWDALIFNNELDLLEIRMHELDSSVDGFIIVESPRTFTNLPKPLYFEENKQRFSQFLHKITHIVIDADKIAGFTSAWDAERHSRQELKRGLAKAGARPNDLVLISDTDEIPRGSVVQLLKNCQGYKFPVAFRSRFYYYSYEWRHIDKPGELNGQTLHPLMFRFRDLSTAGSFRGGARTIIDDAGWHCSWCFPDIASYVKKMESYSHKEHNKAKYRDPKWIKDHIDRGIDLFERWGEYYERQTSTVGLPEYVLQNNQRFAYLLPGGSKYRK